MAIADGDLATAGAAGWGTFLTIGLGLMAYLVRKRDDKIDEHDSAIENQNKAHSALELKVAENYATKTTMMSLFQEATNQNKDAYARVEKRIDETNTAIGKQGEKIDKVNDKVTDLGAEILRELSKKT